MSYTNKRNIITGTRDVYKKLDQNDPDRTRDEFLEAEQNLENQKQEKNKTNLYKSRIIDTEINSSLIFQSVLYFNFFYSIMCFLLQIYSASYKLWIFSPNNLSYSKLALLFVWIIFEMIRLDLGYKANIRQQVRKKFKNIKILVSSFYFL